MRQRIFFGSAIVFAVAATWAIFHLQGEGPYGKPAIKPVVASVWVSAVLLVAALCLNRIESLGVGIMLCVLLFFVGIVCPGMSPYLSSVVRKERRNICSKQLAQIGAALNNYQADHGQFPPLYTRDKDGKPLFGWFMPLFPQFDPRGEDDELSRGIREDESWNSPHNASVLKQIPVYGLACHGRNGSRDCSPGDGSHTDYVPVIGPGTIWQSEGTTRLADFPFDGSRAVAIVEVTDSDVNWAEPFALTVDEAIECLKTKHRVRVSSCYPGDVQVLYANGVVRRFPRDMPESDWRRILSGEISAAELNALACTRSDGKSAATIIVWVVAVAILFHQAVKMRNKPRAAGDASHSGEE